MADYFSRLLLNTTGSSASARREAVLGLVDAEAYSSFQHLLLDEEEKIKKNNFITLFNPVQYDIDADKLQVNIIGDLRVFQGKEQVKESRKSYHLQYAFSGKTGKLLVKEFKDVTEKV
jgi:type IV conjugative transfer system protein TraE